MHFIRKFLASLKSAFGRDKTARRQAILDNAELKQLKAVKRVQTEHEVDLLRIKFTEQLKRVKERETQTTRDYKEFLAMIDEMKSQIVEAYPEMPKVMALIIHQHAKQLIDDMWNNPNEHLQNQCRVRFTRFVRVSYDDTTQGLITEQHGKTPENTLKLIENMDTSS